jgi:hypothetical protein
VVSTLIGLAFGEDKLPAGTWAAQLQAAQLAVLQAIAESDKAWIYGNVNGIVRYLMDLEPGDERAKLRAWLGR